MQALGNDFMVIDAVRQPINLTTALIKKWGARRSGIGFDQLLLLAPATHPKADFTYRIFNADGTEVEQCGNGARCVARFAVEQRLSTKTQLCLQTQHALLTTELMTADWVKVGLGVPKLETKSTLIELDDQAIEIGVLSLGNPHAIIQVEDVTTAAVAEIGAKIAVHHRFPTGINVGFMQIVNPQQIKLRVWERGVGETPACGSGASAAVVFGQQIDKLEVTVDVDLPGGKLQVTHSPQQSVYLSGPAEYVFAGTVLVG